MYWIQLSCLETMVLFERVLKFCIYLFYLVNTSKWMVSTWKHGRTLFAWCRFCIRLARKESWLQSWPLLWPNATKPSVGILIWMLCLLFWFWLFCCNFLFMQNTNMYVWKFQAAIAYSTVSLHCRLYNESKWNMHWKHAFLHYFRIKTMICQFDFGTNSTDLTNRCSHHPLSFQMKYII